MELSRNEESQSFLTGVRNKASAGWKKRLRIVALDVTFAPRISELDVSLTSFECDEMVGQCQAAVAEAVYVSWQS